MEPLYRAARAIVNRVQSSLDGGIFSYYLNNMMPIHQIQTINSSSNPSLIRHMFLTFSRTGYALGFTFGCIWMILLIVLAVMMLRRSKRKSIRSFDRTCGTDQTSAVQIENTRLTTSLIDRTRMRVQSNWIYLAVQFIGLTVLVTLLATAVLLGFAMNAELYTNLSSQAVQEQAVGRLLDPPELDHVSLTQTHLFPRVLRSLAQIKAYLKEFIPNTKNATEPIVKELIEATEQMQQEMTKKFNEVLFKEIGISEAFALGDKVGDSVIALIKSSTRIVELETAFKDHFDRFKVTLHNWLRLINKYSPKDDTECNSVCQYLRTTFVSNLTSRPDTFMPKFDFAVALKFVTTDQNQTAESVQQQLNHGKLLAEKQLEQTKKLMAERINIPKSIRSMIDQQWDMIGSELTHPIQLIDQFASILLRSVAPKVSSGATGVLVFGCLFWIASMCLSLGLFWLILHHHCIPSPLLPSTRQRIRYAAGCSFLLLAISLFCATFLFLTGGYLFTEACRYLQPSQKTISVVRYDAASGVQIHENFFPLDAHINWFLDHHYLTISDMVQNSSTASKPLPVPHIRSPIHGVWFKCRNNTGILDALNAIHDFDMTSLEDPDMSIRFVSIGREIMFESLRNIDVEEMFPKQTEEQLNLANRLDEFIVNFDQIRNQLPTMYFSIRPPDDESGNYTLFPTDDMWTIWNDYYSIVLKDRLPDHVDIRLNKTTEQLQDVLMRMDHAVANISQGLQALSKTQPIKPFVVQLQTALSDLKQLMSDKPVLLEKAAQLFEQIVEQNTPLEARKLITQFGPRLMSRVGQCRRLYEATSDLNGAVCDGVVNVLNGLWLMTGCVTLIGMLSIGLGLGVLMHKSSVVIVSKQDCFNSTLHKGSSVKALPAELEHLHASGNHTPS